MIRSPWDVLWKLWYPVLTRLTRHARVVFLNYGYAGDDANSLPLDPPDEPDRACIQLYHRVVAAVDVRGLDLLEVSCGHGGGASYVARYLKPRSLVGVDRNAAAVARCRTTHHVDGLTFATGDAAALGFPDGRFDAVVNVEASHCYPDLPRFLAEVRRVLRPGGHFLYADFRRAVPDRAALHARLLASGLEVVRCDDITPAVVRGMRANTGRSLDLIRTLVPKPLRPFTRGFAGVEGSPIYARLASGETAYVCYVLRNPA